MKPLFDLTQPDDVAAYRAYARIMADNALPNVRFLRGWGQEDAEAITPTVMWTYEMEQAEQAGEIHYWGTDPVTERALMLANDMAQAQAIYEQIAGDLLTANEPPQFATFEAHEFRGFSVWPVDGRDNVPLTPKQVEKVKKHRVAHNYKRHTFEAWAVRTSSKSVNIKTY